jgi:hypothetical protein
MTYWASGVLILEINKIFPVNPVSGKKMPWPVNPARAHS